MDPRCRFCSILTGTPSWAQPQTIAVADLESGKKQGCKACTLLYNAVPCLVGPEFREAFPSLTFPQRDRADTGPLRIILHPDGLPYAGIVKKLRLQVYREPGMRASRKARGDDETTPPFLKVRETNALKQ